MITSGPKIDLALLNDGFQMTVYDKRGPKLALSDEFRFRHLGSGVFEPEKLPLLLEIFGRGTAYKFIVRSTKERRTWFSGSVRERGGDLNFCSTKMLGEGITHIFFMRVRA